MKSDIYSSVIIDLLKKGYAVKNINGCFDLVARKEGNILLIKVVEDPSSISDASLDEMKKLAYALGASPIILANKSGKRLIIQMSFLFYLKELMTLNLQCLNSDWLYYQTI